MDEEISSSRSLASTARAPIPAEMTAMLMDGILNGHDAQPEGGWIHRCQDPDAALIDACITMLRQQRTHSRYPAGLTLRRRTVTRCLQEIYALIEHIPEAQASRRAWAKAQAARQAQAG